MIWYALGLNDPYKIRYSNGQEYDLGFKNVAITDDLNIDKASFVIWDRVYKVSEKEDVERIKLMVTAPQLMGKIEQLREINKALTKDLETSFNLRCLTIKRVNELEYELAEAKGIIEGLDMENNRFRKEHEKTTDI